MDETEFPGVRNRSSTVGGIFYPEQQDILTGMLTSWGLSPNSAKGAQLLLAPHGAWDITGSIAALAFKRVQEKSGGQKVNRILLLGATHQYKEKEGIFLSESFSFETPLGDIYVDQNSNRFMTSCSELIQINDIPHLTEHSLEVLLPFIKYCFPDVKIIPILVNGQNPELISCLAETLKLTFGNLMEESIFVVSSNVSHHLDEAEALSTAGIFRSALETMDTTGFLSRLAAGRITACGAAILGALLESGLFNGKYFLSLCPFAKDKEDSGETVYTGAFVI